MKTNTKLLLSGLVALMLWTVVGCSTEYAEEVVAPKAVMVTLEAKYIKHGRKIMVFVTPFDMNNRANRYWVHGNNRVFKAYQIGDKVPAVIKSTRDGLGRLLIPNEITFTNFLREQIKRGKVSPGRLHYE